MGGKCKAVVYVFMAVFALAATQARAATVTVSVGDDYFRASSVTIQQGDTVVWDWTGSSTHNVTSKSPSGVLSSGNLKKPASYSHTFTEAPGTYTYSCTRHGGMNGSITVVGS